MFDTKRLPATPGNARRLIAFSKLNGLEVTDQLTELAKRNLVSSASFANSPFSFDDESIAAVQHIHDWQGRAMVLDSGDMRARSVALGALWLKPCNGPVVILARPQQYALWAELIRATWPAASISVFGNSRYEDKGQQYPDGITFETEPNFDADWMITSYGSLIWNNVIGKITPGQMIVEELDNENALNYRWEEAVAGVMREVLPVILIQNINSLPTSGVDALTALQSPTSKASNYLRSLVTEFLWPFNTLATDMLRAVTDQSMIRYLSERNYCDVSWFKILPVLGVNFSLVATADGKTKSLNYFDTSVRNVKNDRNSGHEALYRMVKRESALEAHTGQSMEALVRDSLSGKSAAMTHLRGLQTVQWANTKAHFIKRTMDQITSRMTRTLLVCESPELTRSLKLAMRAEEITHATAGSGNEHSMKIARFLHPHPSWKKHIPEGEIPPTFNVAIVDHDNLIAQSDLWDAATFLVIAEPLLDPALFEAYQAAATERDVRFVQPVMLGTFEEEIFNQLNK